MKFEGYLPSLLIDFYEALYMELGICIIMYKFHSLNEPFYQTGGCVNGTHLFFNVTPKVNLSVLDCKPIQPFILLQANIFDTFLITSLRIIYAICTALRRNFSLDCHYPAYVFSLCDPPYTII
jgi:hypothetical protein